MNHATFAVVVALGVFGFCGLSARTAGAQSTCSVDADCNSGTVCAVVGGTGCPDTRANCGGCLAIACAKEIKACVSPPCTQDSDCQSGKYCQVSPGSISQETGGAGSGPPAYDISYSLGQCVYHGLGALPEDGQDGGSGGDAVGVGGSSAGQTVSLEDGGHSGTPVQARPEATAGADSTSSGCSVALGSKGVSSNGLALCALGLVGMLRRRRSARRA